MIDRQLKVRSMGPRRKSFAGTKVKPDPDVAAVNNTARIFELRDR